MILKNISSGVPDGWRYTHLETGWTSRAGDYWTLKEKVIEHIKGNKLVMPADIDTKKFRSRFARGSRLADASTLIRSRPSTRDSHGARSLRDRESYSDSRGPESSRSPSGRG